MRVQDSWNTAEIPRASAPALPGGRRSYSCGWIWKGKRMELKINELTADVFLDLYISVGWEPPFREQVETALRGSVAAFTVKENGL